MKKRTCHGCRASDDWPNLSTYRCTLGYPIENHQRHWRIMGVTIIDPIPKVECPKPKTYAALFDADRYEPPAKATPSEASQ